MSTQERISADLVVCRLNQLATPGGETGEPLRGAALGDIEVHEGDMWIAAYAGEIVAVGHGYEIRDQLDLDDGAIIIDAAGLVAVPGLIDCHTHACFAGDRIAEFEQRCRGASYEEIHASGGGILATVAATRDASQLDLAASTRKVLANMLEHGATTVEIKSGYGLDPETEILLLRAIMEAGYESAAHVMATLLAAHAVPEGTDADSYIQLCIDEIFPEATEWGLTEAADVFCEQGAFDVAAVAPLSRGRPRGGARAAAARRPVRRDRRARPCDRAGRALDRPPRGDRRGGHCEARGLGRRRGCAPRRRDDARPAVPAACARSSTPAACWRSRRISIPAPAPATRCPAIMHLACTQGHLSPAEALSAVTVNAAHVLGIGDRAGRLRVGQRADIALLDVPDWRYLAYRLGSENVKHVIVEGVWALEG